MQDLTGMKPKLRQNLEREIEIMKKYRHENVTMLYHSYAHAHPGSGSSHAMKDVCLVMEYSAGGDLEKFLSRQPGRCVREVRAACGCSERM